MQHDELGIGEVCLAVSAMESKTRIELIGKFLFKTW